MVKEFSIEELPQFEFRTTKVSPVDLLAITTQIDFDKFQQTQMLYTFALEHVEVKIGEKWFPVKLKNQEVYMPTELEENLVALNQIIAFFLNEVVEKAFTKSRE